MEKKPTKKQQEIMDKKKEIFNTSIELFKKYGYDNVTIKDICSETGVSTGSLYNMFENKASILFQFADLFDQNCYQELKKHMESKNALETVTSYILSILNTFEFIGVDLTLRLHTSHNQIFAHKSEGTKTLEMYLTTLQNQHLLSASITASQFVDMINVIVYGFVYR